MKSLKHLMSRFSYNHKTVKELKIIVSNLSKYFIKVNRLFLKSIGIYATKSTLNKAELIRVINWFVAVVTIEQYDFLYLIKCSVFNDADLALIFGINPDHVAVLLELFHYYGSIFDGSIGKYNNLKIVPSVGYINFNDGKIFYPIEVLFEKWDPELKRDTLDDNFINRNSNYEGGNLWYCGVISFSPKYVSRKLVKRKNFDKEIFDTYVIHIENCKYVFEVNIPWFHRTFRNHFYKVFGVNN